ncbi:hypothetical protein [Streptomyces sp. NPDC051684]|uniref:hypothetical protein n=1 Tax=Streptomyces sp. NPDC051684 TaxID=3365670 RepID=UPI0037A1544F
MTEAAKTDQPVQSTATKTATSKTSAATGKAASTASARSKETEAAKATGRAGALAARAKAGGAHLAAVPAKSAQVATAAWDFVRHRKVIAAGTAAGALAVLVSAYGLGRAGARRGHGPITRATGGRF